MALLNDIIRPSYVRLLHKNGRFAGNFDVQRGVIQFVDRAGTIEYDLVALTEQAQQQQEQVTQRTEMARHLPD